MNLIFEIFGYVGSFMLTILLIPQIYTIIQTKNVESISKVFLIFQVFTTIIWVIYGVGLYLEAGFSGLPVIISNCSLFINSVILLYFKKIYEK